MSEIQQLIYFMKSGKRKRIGLQEYIALQEKKSSWSQKKKQSLLREIHMSKIIEVTYEPGNELKTWLVLKKADTRSLSFAIV